MSNVPIPNLPAVVALSGPELFECVQSGSSARCTASQIASLASSGSPFTTTAIYSNVAIVISQGSIEVYFDASSGEIDQALPSIATLIAYNRQQMRFWKIDSSANAVSISTTDSFLGYVSPQVLNAQGTSLTLQINTDIGAYLLP